MISRRTLLGSLPAAGIGMAAARASAAPSKLLRVGFQKGEPILLAAKQNRSLETLLNPLGIEVQWVEFQFGPPMLEAMRVNAIDIGAVGDTPPVFAQAAHGDLLYIAAQRAGGQAILVPAGSTLQTLQNLKGKKIAFGRGSAAHSLTLAALPAFLDPARYRLGLGGAEEPAIEKQLEEAPVLLGLGDRRRQRLAEVLA